MAHDHYLKLALALYINKSAVLAKYLANAVMWLFFPLYFKECSICLYNHIKVCNSGDKHYSQNIKDIYSSY